MTITYISLFIINCILVLSYAQSVNIYTGKININIINGQKNTLDFLVALKTQPEKKCQYQICYLGWVQQYTIEGENPIQGFNNPQLEIQPVFSFNAISADNFTLTFNPKLNQVWQEIIFIWAQRFNPFAQKQSITSAASNDQKTQNLQNSGDSTLANTTNKNIAGAINTNFFQYSYVKKDIQIKNAEFRRSDFTKSARYNADNILQQTEDSYNFIIASQNPSQNQEQNDQNPIQDIFCNIRSEIKLKDTEEKKEEIEQALKNLYANPKEISLTTIENLRAKPRKNIFNYDDRKNTYDYEPKIDLEQINRIEGIKYDIDPQELFQNPEKYHIGDRRQIFYQVPPLNKNIAAIQKDISVGDLSNKNRLLYIISTHNLVSYTKVLYSKTILGKLVQVTIQAKCDLTIESTGYYITCYAKLRYVIFGSVKDIVIYIFKKSIGQSWSWEKTYSGTWAANVDIPLPPPVSFITIHLYFGVKYWISINLSARPSLYYYPFTYRTRAVVETGIDTEARASIRVVVIQGGVFIKGTLAKVGTDPGVALSFYWYSKTIRLLVTWYFWLHIFQYNWGFFWQYWLPFVGWSGPKIIAQWPITNGYYRKWTIFYYTRYIYY